MKVVVVGALALVMAGAVTLPAHAAEPYTAPGWVRLMENSDSRTYYSPGSVEVNNGGYAQIRVVSNDKSGSASFLYGYVVNCKRRTFMQVTGTKFGSYWGEGTMLGQTGTATPDEKPMGSDGPGAALFNAACQHYRH
jgi:hypothetical protein